MINFLSAGEQKTATFMELAGATDLRQPLLSRPVASRRAWRGCAAAAAAALLVSLWSLCAAPQAGPTAELLAKPEPELWETAQGGGRRIAPLKHKAAGLPLPLAFITPSTA